MTRGTKKVQDELVSKGYRIYRSCDYEYQAKKIAEELRADGYKARALECSTRVRGYYTYCVFYKG